MKLAPLLLSILFCLCTACSFDEHQVDGGTASDGDGGDGGGLDAGSDGGDGSDAAPADLDPTPLPLGPEDVSQIGPSGGIDVGSASLALADGGLVVVFEHYDADFTTGQLMQSRSVDGASWQAPTAIDLPANVYTGSPSIVTIDAQVWLYWAASDGLYESAQLRRALWTSNGWKDPRALAGVAGVSGLLSWPVFKMLEGQRVGLAFRDGQGQPRVAISEDGEEFGQPASVAPDAVAMVALGDLADGTLACTYQTGSGGTMAAWVRTSEDGLTWSDPIQVSQSSSNVHDTCPVRRLDGDLDLYYIWPCSPAGFCLFRRSLAADGSLGLEQQVTSAEVGETSKPSAMRLADGQLLLLWAEITRRGPSGEPVEQVLAGTVIAGDAARP